MVGECSEAEATHLLRNYNIAHGIEEMDDDFDDDDDAARVE
jgi:hypothetical protein